MARYQKDKQALKTPAQRQTHLSQVKCSLGSSWTKTAPNRTPGLQHVFFFFFFFFLTSPQIQLNDGASISSFYIKDGDRRRMYAPVICIDSSHLQRRYNVRQ